MSINKDLKDKLQTSNFTQIKDPDLMAHADSFALSDYKDVPNSYIIHAMIEKLKSTTINSLTGYSPFKFQEVIIGVTQYIDNIVMKHGLENVQILEHDYKYHWRLNQNIQYATIGNLVPNTHMITGLPFPGHCAVHDQMDALISECNEKNISLHLDCAWMGCVKNVDFDFDQPCIKSFAMSFSKAYGLGWNRIGIRWSRTIDPTDSVTIFNHHDMYNPILIKVAYHYMKEFDIDYLWNKYGYCYQQICKSTLTMPTNVVWLGKDIRGQLIGMADALQSIGVTN